MLSHRPQTGQQASDEMSSEEVAKDLAFLDIMNYENTNYTKGLKKEHKGREKKNQNKATKAETVEYQTPKVAQKEDTTKGNKRRGQGGTAFRGVDPRRVGAASRFPAAQVHLRGDTQPAEEMVIHERESEPWTTTNRLTTSRSRPNLTWVPGQEAGHQKRCHNYDAGYLALYATS